MQHRENKMGTMHVGKLLLTMSAPMMVSMLVQSLYNIVDSIFVAMYSQEGLTAVSLCFPIQSLMISLASGTGVGINSVLSRKLGEKRFDEANKVAAHGVFVGIITSIVVAIIGWLISGSFFQFFTNTQKTIEMGRQYILICTIFSSGVFMQIIFERLLQSTGKTHLSMIAQMSGALTNLILDPILIFGLFGFPRWGVAGAAIATVIGQWIAMTVAILLNHFKNKQIKVSVYKFKPDKKIIRDIYRVGVPAIIMQSITSIMTVGMNKILANDTAISIFGIYFKINSFIFMPIFGMTNALIPIFAYNFGARNKERIMGTMKYAMAISVSLMAIGTVLIAIFPEFFLDMFNADASMFKMGTAALKIIPVGFCFAGYCIVIISLLQAIDLAAYSIIVSVTRQLFVILPSAYILKRFLGFPAVWASIPLAEIVATFICVGLYYGVCKKKLEGLSVN